MADEIQRLLRIPDKSFFVFGPRGVGKSTWLRRVLPPDSLALDLLRAELFLELGRDPGNLEARIGRRPPGSWICIDEIQKLPTLLDEVHRLIETRRLRFALSGSSARSLRRTGVNLLAGRAITRSLAPFVSAELGERFDLSSALEFGLLPLVALDPRNAVDTLSAYVHTYVREELREVTADLLLGERARARGQFRPAAVEQLVRDHGEGRADNGHRLWCLLVLELWQRLNVDSPTPPTGPEDAARALR